MTSLLLRSFLPARSTLPIRPLIQSRTFLSVNPPSRTSTAHSHSHRPGCGCGSHSSSASLFASSSSSSAVGEAVRGLKVRTAIRKMCASCQFVKRKGLMRVICKENAKHKQRQGWIRPKRTKV